MSLDLVLLDSHFSNTLVSNINLRDELVVIVGQGIVRAY
mgnify:CR=1 FL=1